MIVSLTVTIYVFGPDIVAAVRALLVMSINNMYVEHLLIKVPGTVQLNFAATIVMIITYYYHANPSIPSVRLVFPAALKNKQGMSPLKFSEHERFMQ